jgi:hypothetical protein
MRLAKSFTVDAVFFNRAADQDAALPSSSGRMRTTYRRSDGCSEEAKFLLCNSTNPVGPSCSP